MFKEGHITFHRNVSIELSVILVSLSIDKNLLIQTYWYIKCFSKFSALANLEYHPKIKSQNWLLRVISIIKKLILLWAHQTAFEKVQTFLGIIFWMTPLDFLVNSSVIEYLNYDQWSGHDTQNDQKIHLKPYFSQVNVAFKENLLVMCVMSRPWVIIKVLYDTLTK